jgi:hypothetical protein
METDTDTKLVVYLKETKPLPQKIKKTREVTKTSTWIKQISNEDLLSTTAQLSLLTSHVNPENKKQAFVYSQIKQKIYGYRHQDILKKKLNEESFVDLEFVIQLLLSSNLHCFYCRENVSLLYETVRDPKQWTLERVYNTKGHNKDNVEICCLSCNIKRRTMYHEKYKFTKQITFQKET